MEKRDGKEKFLKIWTEINNNNSADNDESDLLPIMYKIGQIGKSPSFSIGDNWTEKAGKKIYFYKVAAIEDIVTPSGVYRCYKITEETEGGVKNYYWFAPDIGLVKWKIGKNKGILKECLKEKTGQQNVE